MTDTIDPHDEPSVARTLENTMKNNLKHFNSIYEIPISRITGTATASIMGLDGFCTDDFKNILDKRNRRLLMREPERLQRENMNELFIEFVSDGEEILKNGVDIPLIDKIKIDLSPVKKNPVLQDPASYTWGQLPITARFSAIIKIIDEPFMLISGPVWGPIWVCSSADLENPANKRSR